MIEVFKFGGASVKNADAVKNVAQIIKQKATQKLVVVVSAMGKTTNALELLHLLASEHKTTEYQEQLEQIKDYHQQIVNELFIDDVDAKTALEIELEKVYQYLQKLPPNLSSTLSDRNYDQIVAVGELISTKIISAYLTKAGITHKWVDARKIIGTDSTFKEAEVNFQVTAQNIQNQLTFKEEKIYLTQGFIGFEKLGFMTTLGREGSDFSASIFAYCLEAASVTIWKDVPGFLNADPAYFKNAERLPQISYQEAIELAFYGAKIIHPNTLKPLQNKGIPLYIKSFLHPDEPGTVIDANTHRDTSLPSYIFKKNQVLFSISSRDYSFILERDLSAIFSIVAKNKGKIQIMQNSALNFSLVAQLRPGHLGALVEELSKLYLVKYNDNVDLLTIRHYNEQIIKKLISDREVLLEQKTRNTIRILLRSKN